MNVSRGGGVLPGDRRNKSISYIADTHDMTIRACPLKSTNRQFRGEKIKIKIYTHNYIIYRRCIARPGRGIILLIFLLSVGRVRQIGYWLSAPFFYVPPTEPVVHAARRFPIFHYGNPNYYYFSTVVVSLRTFRAGVPPYARTRHAFARPDCRPETGEYSSTSGVRHFRRIDSRLPIITS